MLRFLSSLILFLAIGILLSLGSYAHATSPATSGAFEAAKQKDWVNAYTQAMNAGSPALAKLMTWQYVLDPDSGARFEEITRFMKDNPRWPEQKKLRLRAESAMRSADLSDADIIAWFGNDAPFSGNGKLALAEALSREGKASSEKITALLRDAWRYGDFDEAQEKRLLDAYSDRLRREDSIARIDRLLWEQKIGAATRRLKDVPEGYQKLFKARIALMENRKFAILSVAQVPSSLKNDPGLIYDRMVFRARKDDSRGVRDMLLIAPVHPPYPEKWWRQRELQVRKSIDERRFGLTRRLLANHGQMEGQGLADALWLSGWLKTEFTNDAKGGVNDFRLMYAKVRFPVSKARAAYWAARASEKTGDADNARKWYATAANYPTTFYGQLGAVKANMAASFRLPPSPSIDGEVSRNFDRSDLAQAIRQCMTAGEIGLANRLLALTVENDDEEDRIALFSELGKKSGYPYLSVRASKKALQQNVVLVDSGYPTPATPSVPLERPLTLAITRQESEFDPNAMSPSRAVGMMQLLPSTAREVARKNDLPFSPDKLYEPQYNMTLGSLYLSRLINSYDGSYIMGIAAYNAGPGNVRNWVENFGTPNNNLDNAVNWIEKIPFSETRNYVQRVLENLQVYRQLNAGSKGKLLLAEDMVR